MILCTPHIPPHAHPTRSYHTVSTNAMHTYSADNTRVHIYYACGCIVLDCAPLTPNLHTAAMGKGTVSTCVDVQENNSNLWNEPISSCELTYASCLWRKSNVPPNVTRRLTVHRQKKESEIIGLVTFPSNVEKATYLQQWNREVAGTKDSPLLVSNY